MQLRHLFTLLLSALPLTLAADLNNNAITAPIAGDVITAGQPYAIKWTNMKGNLVTITLIDGPANKVVPVKEIANGAPNTGVYTWSVPDDIPPSQTYAIRITYNNNPADYNYSDRFAFENESVVSSSAVSSSAETSTGPASTKTETASSASKTESETTATTAATTESEASSTVESTESEATTSAASSETETATTRATKTTESTRETSTTVSRATKTSPPVQTNMAPVDQQSSASRSISGRSLIVTVAGMAIGGAFIFF
ncbi:uncharacterized protein DFL_001259 [Arthrobotrys flagrans]|uniref:Yeast cell wall synthesis Kre9/Knh1-like N-terminal domain-containing protein n=1 Tax=Arthrobotrys flagrans TaxID=97331 RepID=A0A437AGM6_ARTFL|nr:hypothetical protein DFL_001259 [Arthrobotrys flagrans]